MNHFPAAYRILACRLDIEESGSLKAQAGERPITMPSDIWMVRPVNPPAEPIRKAEDRRPARFEDLFWVWITTYTVIPTAARTIAAMAMGNPPEGSMAGG